MKRRSLKNVSVNADRDYIRVGTCSRCRRREVSIVVHHPPEGDRSFSVCNYCSMDLWQSVGETNKENFLPNFKHALTELTCLGVAWMIVGSLSTARGCFDGAMA